MNSQTSTSDAVSNRHGGTELGKRGALAVVLSLVVNGLLLGVVLATGVVTPFRPLAFGPVLMLSAVGAAGATATYWVLTRVSDRPDRLFPGIAGVVLVLSFVPDVTFLPGQQGATWGAIAVLMVMHVTVAAASVWALVYWR